SRAQTAARPPRLCVERRRAVLVDDAPLAGELAVADGDADPHLDLLPVPGAPVDGVQAAREGDVLVLGDVEPELADLVAERALELGEPLLGALPHRLDAPALE